MTLRPGMHPLPHQHVRHYPVHNQVVQRKLIRSQRFTVTDSGREVQTQCGHNLQGLPDCQAHNPYHCGSAYHDVQHGAPIHAVRGVHPAFQREALRLCWLSPGLSV